MATRLSRKDTSEPQYEEFEPIPDLQESSDKYDLLVNLPGFKKEDFRVQLDGLGNLTVKGKTPIGDNKFKRCNMVFLLPKDSDLEKIRGKFEGNILSITLPRREKAIDEKKELEKELPKEETKSEEKKEEDKPPMEEATSGEKNENEQVEPKEEQPKANDHKEKEEELEETKPNKQPKPTIPEMKHEARKFKDTIEKTMINWKGKISQEMEELSNKVSVDNLLETLNNNRKVIAVGVAAFSIGFIVSRKLIK